MVGSMLLGLNCFLVSLSRCRIFGSYLDIPKCLIYMYIYIYIYIYIYKVIALIVIALIVIALIYI